MKNSRERRKRILLILGIMTAGSIVILSMIPGRDRAKAEASFMYAQNEGSGFMQKDTGRFAVKCLAEMQNNIKKAAESNDQPKKERMTDHDDSLIVPPDKDMLDEKEIGEWVYFRYMVEETYQDYTVKYPALFRYRKGDKVAERVNWGACYTFDAAGEKVYYLNSTTGIQDHGELYVSEPDGKNEIMLENELNDFQIIDEKYIYYTYCYDTVGVGLDGHALHRMNLDGSGKMTVAYEVSGIDINVSHFDYRVEGNIVDCGDFIMEMGEPADGYEKIVFKNAEDNDWVYYVTNRLMKARKDGSERTQLDGEDDYYYEIEEINGDWIYYIKGGEKYKIRTDGSGKEKIT